MILIRTFCFFSALGFSFAALADPYVDPHPYQMQTLIRSLKGENSAESGTLFKVLANAADFTNFIPGEKPQTIPNTPVMYAYENGLAPISVMGGNYFFFEGNTFGTLSADGLFSYFPAPKAWQPDVVGGVFYTKMGTNELVMIDSFGIEYSDNYVSPGQKLVVSNIKLAGGNFFIDDDGYLTTFKSSGDFENGQHTSVGMMTKWDADSNPNFSNAFAVGGNYFLMREDVDGVTTTKVVTINSQTGFYSTPFVPDSEPKFLGGNYYIDMNDVLFTIDSHGNSYKTDPIRANPILKGYSFILYADGSLTFIDQNGTPRDSITVVKNGVGVSSSQIDTNVNLSNFYLPNYNEKNHCH